MNDFIEETFRIFKQTFNKGDYYTCHDYLEEIWMIDKQNYLIKGMLQMCVGLYHYSYGNIKGARMMLQSAHHYLTHTMETMDGVNVQEVCQYIDQCLFIIPQTVELVPFEKIKSLPPLPSFLFP
ncbi:MAG: DUF309 domain-containing protein [Bacillus sp. (in: Bacteria)]|nr:DUF309 domain-containing protein [Bacillus sp. (in: firmicutes)]